MDLAVLIPAILTYVRYKDGFATKTKLLKLLYLLDIEAFRTHEATLTGFDWHFYKYGPWSAQYDDVLNQLANSNAIRLRAGNKTDLDTVFVDTVKPIQLSEAFPTIVEELRARRIIEAWADRPTGELLEYVYFHTAPMRDARRGELLDFTSVRNEEPAPDYKRTRSQVGVAEQKSKTNTFREAIAKARKKNPENYFRKPRYDADYWKAVDILDREPD